VIDNEVVKLENGENNTHNKGKYNKKL